VLQAINKLDGDEEGGFTEEDLRCVRLICRPLMRAHRNAQLLVEAVAGRGGGCQGQRVCMNRAGARVCM
jgi:hypothetical protein